MSYPTELASVKVAIKMIGTAVEEMDVAAHLIGEACDRCPPGPEQDALKALRNFAQSMSLSIAEDMNEVLQPFFPPYEDFEG